MHVSEKVSSLSWFRRWTLGGRFCFAVCVFRSAIGIQIPVCIGVFLLFLKHIFRVFLAFFNALRAFFSIFESVCRPVVIWVQFQCFIKSRGSLRIVGQE